MILKPNLPDIKIKTAIVSSDITTGMKNGLRNLGVNLCFLSGNWNCDKAVLNHPDIHFLHFDCDTSFYLKNFCSMSGDLLLYARNMNEVLIDTCNKKINENECKLNCAIIGNDLICNTKLIDRNLLAHSRRKGMRIIHVNQGYAKCNICIVDDKSIITEDIGIYNTLSKFGYDVLLLKTHSVILPGHAYGFIGGASGKISKDKITFFGCIESHPEFFKISEFLSRRDVKPISLSHEPLCDFGSLLPVE